MWFYILGDDQKFIRSIKTLQISFNIREESYILKYLENRVISGIDT